LLQSGACSEVEFEGKLIIKIPSNVAKTKNLPTQSNRSSTMRSVVGNLQKKGTEVAPISEERDKFQH